MNRHFLFSAAVALAALLAGCGSTSKTATSSSAAATPSAAASSSSASSAGGAPAAAQAAALITTKRASGAGTVLAAGAKRLTVYLFEADRPGRSSCSAACAHVWPPLLSTGAPKARGGAAQPALGMITRSDGTHQVTYRGHPLYLFARDKDNGDTYGQGLKSFGAAWYALAPTGRKVDNS